jgi:hypothetical protein
MVMSSPVERVQTAALSRIDYRVWRACIWGGVVFLVGMGVFWAAIAGWVPPPSQNWDADTIARYFNDRQARIRIGMEGVLLIAVFYYLFSLGLSKIMEQVEGPRHLLSRIQLFGGLATTLVVITMALLWLTASFRVGQRSAADIQLLNDLGFMVFVMTAMVTALQFVAFGLVWLIYPRAGELIPRWVGWLSLWVEMTFFGVFFMPWLFTGPFAWHGLINFYLVMGLFFAWIVIVIWYALRAINTLQHREFGPTDHGDSQTTARSGYRHNPMPR